MNYEDMTNDKLIERLEELNEKIKVLIHDIGSPLSAIWGYTDLAMLWLQKEDDDREEISEYLNEINGHMKEIEQIIKGAARLVDGVKDSQASLGDSRESDIPLPEHEYEEVTNTKFIANADMMINRLDELLSKSDSVVNIHMNEEDIAGTEVKINQSGSDYIKAMFPKKMDLYLFIPISSIYYIRVKPSDHSVDIYLR